MKKNKFQILAMLFLAVVVTFSACKKEEDLGDAPVISSVSISDDNLKVTVSFSTGVYATADESGALTKASFTVTLAGGNATLTDYTVTHTAGSNLAEINLTLAGGATGLEVITVKPAGAESIFSQKGAAMEITQEKTVNLNDLGIVGKWYSAGENVAVLLSFYFKIDSIYAEFKPDMSYLVESYAEGVKSEMRGVFTQTKSSTANIWTITVNQSVPTALTSEGIFEIYYDQSPNKMKYEVAQTEPQQPGVTPPTPAGGFGSTSGGAFGTTNVQTYLRLN